MPETKQKKKKSRVLRRFWRGLGSQMGQWMVQEGRWGYGEHSPKIWCGGAECEVSRTEDSEDHSKHKTKQNDDPAKKKVVEKKKKNWSQWYQGGSTFDTFQNAPETRPLDQ